MSIADIVTALIVAAVPTAAVTLSRVRKKRGCSNSCDCNCSDFRAFFTRRHCSHSCAECIFYLK